MNERRPLIDGVRPPLTSDPAAEQQFVYQTKPEEGPPGTPPATPPAAPKAAPVPTYRTGRSPLSTRIRADLADGLKRASLERQLKGVTPNTVQDILEAVLEPLLKRNGYLD